jgi:hypothetical protein
VKIDKSSVKAAIRENVQETGGARRKASALFSEGRRLRKNAVKVHDPKLRVAYFGEDYNKGWALHHQAVLARCGANCRTYGRGLTLAAAFLNNTKYSACEPKCLKATQYLLTVVTHWLRPCFPEGKAPTLEMVHAWFNSDVTRHELMPEPQEELQRAA